MRNLKKFLALVLAMMMALSLMVTVNAVTANVVFPDTEEVIAEFQDDVIVLSGMGVIKGHADTQTFAPKAKVTRAQMAAIVYRLATGDASDARSDLYKEYQKFSDVRSDAWYAGYVGYCADAGYIQGYPDGSFKPNADVTGYQALAMILRAMGYNEPGHNFTGAGWMAETGATATQRGMLVNVNKSIYANTLNQAAPRELVAEVAFQGAIKEMVEWTNAFGYQITHYSGDAWSGEQRVTNDSLGWKYYGLTWIRSIVVGNQATGETATLLGLGFALDGTAGVVKDPYGFDIKWYVDDDKGTTDDTSDDEIKFVYRYNNNDSTKGLNPDYDKATIANKAGTQVALSVYVTGTNGISEGSYGYTNKQRFDFNTGLNMFGHEAKVWYNGKNWVSNIKGYETYALLDKATWTANVYAADAKLSEANAKNDPTKALLGRAAQDAGFSVNLNTSTAHFSDRYSQMDPGTAANGTNNVSPIRTYALVSNSPNKAVDVVIALSAEVGQITEKNTTAATQYLTLGDNNANQTSFGNGTGANADRIFLDNLTPDTAEAQQKVGEVVTAYQIVGTSFTLTQAASNAGITTDDNWAEVQYQLDPMKYRDVTVATYFAPNANTTPTTVTIDGYDKVIISVTPAGESAVQMSGITWGNGTNSEIISKVLPIPTNETTASNAGEIVIKAGMTYRMYEDIVGRFISLTPVPNTEFIYGTYADYVIGGLGTGTIGYNLVGVNWDGEIKGENTVNFYNENPINGDQYDNFTVTKKDQGNTTATSGGDGNEIHNGYDTGYMYNAANGNVDPAVTGATAMAATTWSFDSADAAHGFKKVTNSGVDYLVTNDTEFIIVTGTGTATLKVEKAKGITGLLAGGTSADITHTAYTSDPALRTDNMVYFRTDVDLFGTAYVNNNRTIMKVILADGNLTRWNAQQLYYNFDQANATGVHLTGATPSNPSQTGASVEQYALWNNGKLGYYFVDTSVSTKVPAAAGTPGATWTGTSDVEAETFYTLSPIKDVNGVTIYKAVALMDPAKVDYTTGHNSKSGGNAVTYQYVTVNNLSTGLLQKDSDQLVYTIDPDVIVCDVQYKVNPVVTSATRNEITNIKQLNDAVSVKLTNPATFGYVNIQVAVVYEGSVITCIYVVNVPTLST